MDLKKITAIFLMALGLTGCYVSGSEVPIPKPSEEDYQWLEQGRTRLSHVRILKGDGENTYVRCSEGYFLIHGDYIACLPRPQKTEEVE